MTKLLILTIEKTDTDSLATFTESQVSSVVGVFVVVFITILVFFQFKSAKKSQKNTGW